MSKRATKQGQQHKKPRTTPAQQNAKKSEGLSVGSKIVIIAFAAILALSMMVPSLAGLFGADASTSQAPASIEELDARYTEITEPLEQKIARDPDDMESVRALAQAYMNWGYNVSYLAAVDAETSHANELFSKALQLFDAYLDTDPEDSGQIKVDRALCLLYAGETSNAREALEAITEEDPENAVAWANLGLVYEIVGDTEQARNAYSAAIEHDPDNEQGAKAYASSRLLSINNSSSGSEGLPGTLRDLSDTSV